MKQLTSYTKIKGEKRSVVTLWRCTSCLATEKVVAALLVLFLTLAGQARAEPSASECLAVFIDEGFRDVPEATIEYIPESIAVKGIKRILTQQEQLISDAKERNAMA